MKNKVALLSLALASSVFALDEYLPLMPNTLELDAGINPVFGDGSTVTGVPLQAKYGVMPGLDLELGLVFNTGDVSGLSQPELAAKYAIPGDMGLAAFVNVALPFATGDKDVTGLALGITPGVVYGKNFDKIQAVAKASYLINLEADDLKAGNVLDIYLKPGYAVDEKCAAYLGVDYKMYGEKEVAGTAVGGDGSGFTLLPGVTYMLSDKLSFEANIPIVLSDDLNGKSWGILASVYYTMPSM